MSNWKQVGENLVQHQAGTIYLRASVGGKVVRKSLKTSSLRIAKLKRDPELKKLRDSHRARDTHAEARTFRDALTLLELEAIGPHLKPSTRADYKKTIGRLRKSLPLDAHARRWSAGDARDWWEALSGRYHAQKANQALRMIRRAFGILIRGGARSDDPTEGLRPIKLAQVHRELPSRAQIEAILADVRAQRKRDSVESARILAFHAYTGMRPGERQAVEWKHVEPDWILVAGGNDGTKNRQIRRVPISPPLRALLDEMRPENPAGPVFGMKSPRYALQNACHRLGLPHLRIYDLRHWFATWALEQGVDVKTVAGWMGHQDGGALLLRTYAHLQDRHSLEMAKRLK